MTDIINFNSPISRLVADLRLEISDQARELSTLREEAARVAATKDMLRLLLADMDLKVTTLAEAVSLMSRNINELRNSLMGPAA